jgi:hypothetical protein
VAAPINPREQALSDFLSSCGQARYLPVLLEHEMFLDVLAIMDEENFTDVGVPKGPCLVIMKGTYASFCRTILVTCSCLVVHNALLHVY